MFNLNQASENLRKAAALVGIKSGKYEPLFPENNANGNDIIAKVFNRNNPNGVDITAEDVELAKCYTWKEIS